MIKYKIVNYFKYQLHENNVYLLLFKSPMMQFTLRLQRLANTLLQYPETYTLMKYLNELKNKCQSNK